LNRDHKTIDRDDAYDITGRNLKNVCSLPIRIWTLVLDV